MAETSTPAVGHSGDRGGRWSVGSWCLYDWANSAFTTLVVTFVYATYFTGAIADDIEQGTALWSLGIGISAVLIAFLAPILGAAADGSGLRRRYLVVSTLVSVIATAALTFVKPGWSRATMLALIIFIVANVAFELAMVFYNAFLPGMVDREKLGRTSGYGWALGYAGGLACMVVGLVGFIGIGEEGWLGIPRTDGLHVRSTNLLVAAWFLIFSLPLFITARQGSRGFRGKQGGGNKSISAAFGALRSTFREVRQFRQAARFLVARLIYNDGLVTVFAFGGIYAAGTFGMDQSEVLMFGIGLNAAAGLGTFVFGFIDDWIGGKKTIVISLVALGLATLLAAMAPDRTWLWIAGMGIGIFAGPNQAASRSLMSRFIPSDKQSEFFGFFAFSGKITSFLGPILLGSLTLVYGQRVGVGSVVVFFIAGLVLLAWVNEKDGIDAAARV